MTINNVDDFYQWRVKHKLNIYKEKKPFSLNKWHILAGIIGIGIICNLPTYDNTMVVSVHGEIIPLAEAEIYPRPNESDLIASADTQYQKAKTKAIKKAVIPVEKRKLPSPYTEIDNLMRDIEKSEKALPERKVIEYLATPYKKSAPKKKTNTEIALAFFESKGYTKHHSAAIVGNLICESGLNTKARGDGGKAFGIAQWHPDRQRMFKKIIGKDIKQSSLIDQLEFVHWELHNSEKKAGGLFKAAKNVWDAASLFDRHYERSSGKARKTRISLAKKLLSSLD